MFRDKDVFLFDLDGTLLTIETDEFLKYYFEALSSEFKDLCRSRDDFINVLMESTQKMIKNNGHSSNQQVFMKDFMERSGVKTQAEAEQIKERFDHFYQNEFEKLGKYFEIDTETPFKIIEFLKQKGKKLVLATNPLFPKEAVEKRLGWTGIDPADFEILTHYGNMSYAKPNPNYYQEILDILDVDSESCLMIGNDLKEDAAASEVGIKTLIIEDKIIERKDSHYPIEWRGSLKELEKLIKAEI